MVDDESLDKMVLDGKVLGKQALEESLEEEILLCGYHHNPIPYGEENPIISTYNLGVKVQSARAVFFYQQYRTSEMLLKYLAETDGDINVPSLENITEAYKETLESYKAFKEIVESVPRFKKHFESGIEQADQFVVNLDEQYTTMVGMSKSHN